MTKELPGQLSIFDIFGLNCFKSNNIKSIRSNEDYLLECILLGSGFENGKSRIYDIIKSDMAVKDQITAIKKEYGVGGARFKCEHLGEPNTLIGYYTGYINKGLTITYQDENCKEKDILFSWSEVRKAIITQINTGLYLECKKKKNIA